MWNRIVFSIESSIRNSWLANFLPLIRTRYPKLHMVLLRVRDRLLPYRTSVSITRYQYRAIYKYFDFIAKDDSLKTVLEIGSDLSGAVAREMKSKGVKTIIGINPVMDFFQGREEPPSTPYVHFLRSDARWLPFEDKSISSIFSVATFEHINNLELAIDEFFRVLRPGGVLYTDFGPIWSCSIGHHVFAKVGDEEARHWKPGKNPVPNFGHLLLPADELRVQIKGKVSEALLDAIIAWIYEQDEINRLFYEDYIRIFEQSDFQIESINKVLEHIDSTLEKSLQERYAPYQEFRCRMLEVVLSKPGSP